MSWAHPGPGEDVGAGGVEALGNLGRLAGEGVEQLAVSRGDGSGVDLGLAWPARGGQQRDGSHGVR